MILNIFGPSGSGKTTFIRELLKYEKIQIFYEKFTKKTFNHDLKKKISISLVPLPLFRGTLEEYFDIFAIDINVLLNLDHALQELSDSIFEKIDNKATLNKICIRNLETFSAGEIRRIFILKSLLVESNMIIIDEPFSNSDQKLWNIIFSSLKKSRSILLSHSPLENIFNCKQNIISIHIDEVKKKFIILK